MKSCCSQIFTLNPAPPAACCLSAGIHFHSQTNFIVAWNANGNLGLVKVSQDFANRLLGYGFIGSSCHQLSYIKTQWNKSWRDVEPDFHVVYDQMPISCILSTPSLTTLTSKHPVRKLTVCVLTQSVYTLLSLSSPSSKAWTIGIEYGQNPDFSAFKLLLSEQIPKLSHITNK